MALRLTHLRKASNTLVKFLSREERCFVAPHLQAKVKDHLKELRISNLPRPLAMGAALVVFFLVRPGGWTSAADRFSRVNNIGTLFELFVLYLGVRLKINCILKHVELILFLSMIHALSYLSMSGCRTAKLYSFFQVTIPCDESEEEAYYIIMCLIAIFLCGQAHIMPLSHFFIINLFAVLSWVVQISLLDCRRTTTIAIRLGLAYCALCCSAYLGMQQSVQLWKSEFVRRDGELASIMRTLQHASMPIAVIAPVETEAATLDSNAGTQLTVTLWSDGFEELTSVTIPAQRQMFLEELSCFRMRELHCLEHAIRRALSNERESSKQVILPAVAPHGVVWLQIDVWPLVLSDVLKVIIMGSNVTEWVERHSSLLRVVNDEHEQFTNERERIPDNIHAFVNGDSLILTKCSADFNLLFPRPVEGLSVLDLVVSAEERCQLSYVITEVMGDRISRSITVLFKTHPFKPRSRGRISRREPRSHFSCRSLNLWVSIWTGSNEEVAGSVQLLLEALEVGDHQELPSNTSPKQSKTHWDPHGTDVVPEHAESSFSEPDARPQGNVRAVLRHTKSDPGLLGKNEASDATGDSTPSSAGTSPIVLEAVASSIVEFTRHLGTETFRDSQVILWKALRHVGNNQQIFSMRWGKACDGWTCRHCNGTNDLDDIFCEVCKMENDMPVSLLSPDDTELSGRNMPGELSALEGYLSTHIHLKVSL